MSAVYWAIAVDRAASRCCWFTLAVHSGATWTRALGRIPKGEIDGSAEERAHREFAEELGPATTIGSLEGLGGVQQRGASA